MGRADALLHGVQAGLQLWDHAALDDLVAPQGLGLAGGHSRNQLTIPIQYPGDVRQHHQLGGLQGCRDLAGDRIGVDVIGLAIGADADRGDHRDQVRLRKSHQ